MSESIQTVNQLSDWMPSAAVDFGTCSISDDLKQQLESVRRNQFINITKFFNAFNVFCFII